MEDKVDIDALNSLLSNVKLSKDIAGAVSKMIKKEKEKRVLQVHNYKISGPFVSNNRTLYTTRAPWLDSKKLGRTEYDDLIDILYEHYFGEATETPTVQQIFEEMIKHYEENHIVSDLTITHYKSEWKKYIVQKNAMWLYMPICEVVPEQIFEHYRVITANYSMKRSTFNNVKTVVNAVFDFAINRNEHCIKASMIDTRRLKFAPARDKWDGVYTVEDREKILRVCEEMSPTVYTKAIELMFCLDIRIGELRALQKDNIDLDARTVYIGHQMTDQKTDTAKRHSVRGNIMKGGKEAGKRTVPLSDRAVNVINWLFEYKPDTEWLLPSSSGDGPIFTNRFNDTLKKVCGKAGVKYFSSHGIRFHVISAMYDAGIPEKKIQKLSGHTTAMMTRHYNRCIFTDDDSDKIREVLN